MHKSLSIIIPAYNEERYLGACLDAIAAQTDMPDEVIVVDNNSTDRTAAIARSYPFVRLLHESQPGLTPARNRGFAAAHGDIFGRINADAILAPDWVARARRAFEADNHLGGMTGPAVSDTLPFTHALPSTIWSRGYFWWTDGYLRIRTLWGANMLISRHAWKDICPKTARDDRCVHEDQDISLLLAGHGWRTVRDSGLLIATYGHDYHEWPKFKEYMQRRWKTKARHTLRGTLTAPQACILPRWYTAWLTIVTFLPMSLFVTTSFLMGLPATLSHAAQRSIAAFSE